MARLGLSFAVGDYDRIRPLVDGAVQIDGVDPTFMLLEPEEIFFRAFRRAEFDVCELSLSSFTVKTAAGTSPYVGVPVFPSRAFRHTAISVRTDRIKLPQDLKGKRVGVPEYQLTACVWGRAILEDDYGVKPSDITWVRGGLEEPGRIEKIDLNLPADVRLEAAPADTTLSAMLERGEIDGVLGPRIPSCQARGAPDVGWLWPDTAAAARDYYSRTKVFPIMHLLGLRRPLAEAHPWLPAALLKAFTEAKAVALAKLADTSAPKITLPFVEEQVSAARALMGPDYWSYGLEPNRHVLETFLRHHHAQGLSARRVRAEELFDPGALEAHKIMKTARRCMILAGAALALMAARLSASAQAPENPATPLIRQAFAMTEGRFIPAFDRYCGTDPTLPVALGKGAAATPSRLFDNLYYVGRTDVGAWVIKTSGGLVLIDTLYSPDDAEKIIAPGMRKLGLDPDQIKLVILTHFHGDHAGGMPYFKAKGVKVMVSEKDWGPLGGVPGPEAVLHDQQVVKVGDTAFTTLLTPGHTPGTIAIVFPVYERGGKHVAVVMGGLGPRGGVPEYRGEIEGIERMAAFARTAGVDTPLDPHEVIVDSAAFETIMHGRRPGQPNELITTPARYQTFLNMVATCHRAHILTLEQKAAAPAAK